MEQTASIELLFFFFLRSIQTLLLRRLSSGTPGVVRIHDQALRKTDADFLTQRVALSAHR